MTRSADTLKAKREEEKAKMKPKKLTANIWLNDTAVPIGYNKHNQELRIELNIIIREFAFASCFAFWMVKELKIEWMRRLFMSASGTKRFWKVVRAHMTRHQVTDEYYPAIRADVEAAKERLRWFWKITKENAKFTKYFPYFESLDWSFTDMIDSIEDWKAFNKSLLEGFEKYYESHKAEVDAYMEYANAEAAKHEAYIAKIKAKAEEEKKAKREARKAANAEVREIRANRKKHLAEIRKENKMYEFYCK